MTPTPWHFWPIVVVTFLWHLVGVIDYTASMAEWGPWMRMVSDRQASFVVNMPNWVDATWAIAVWAGFVGVIVLATGTSFAPLILAISAIAMVVLTFWLIFVSTPSLLTIADQTALWVMLGSSVGAILLWLYARAMRRGGVID